MADIKKGGKNTTIQPWQQAKRKFLAKNVSDLILRNKLRGMAVRDWPKRLQSMYKASRRH